MSKASMPRATSFWSASPDEGGNQRSSEVIRGHPSLGGPRRPSKVISAHQRSSEIIRAWEGLAVHRADEIVTQPETLQVRRPRVRIVRALRVHEGHKDHLMRALIRRTQAHSGSIRTHSVHKCHEDHKVPVAVRLDELIIRRNQRSSVALTLFRSQCALMSSFVSL